VKAIEPREAPEGDEAHLSNGAGLADEDVEAITGKAA
jgi:hypothetical protein